MFGSFSAVVLGAEVIYEMKLTLRRDRKVPSLTLIQHKSKVTSAKAHYEISETESRPKPSMTLSKQCIVLGYGRTFNGFG